MRAQVVHNDLAPTNVLVDDTLAVTGITDFGDMTHTALVCDLAVAAADVLSGRDDGLELAHEVRGRVRLRHPAGAAGGRTRRRPDGRPLRRRRPDHRLADPAAGLRAGDRRRGVPPARGHARRRPGHAHSAVHHRLGERSHAHAARRARAALPPAVHDRAAPGALAGAGRAGAELRRAGASRGRPRGVPRGRGRAPLPRCLQQRAGAGALPPGGRRRRLLPAGHAEHQQPLPAGGSRRAGRTAAGHPPGSVRPGPAGELRQRGERPGLADRAARHRRLGRHRDLVGLPRRHGGDVRVLPGELG